MRSQPVNTKLVPLSFGGYCSPDQKEAIEAHAAQYGKESSKLPASGPRVAHQREAKTSTVSTTPPTYSATSVSTSTSTSAPRNGMTAAQAGVKVFEIMKSLVGHLYSNGLREDPTREKVIARIYHAFLTGKKFVGEEAFKALGQIEQIKKLKDAVLGGCAASPEIAKIVAEVAALKDKKAKDEYWKEKMKNPDFWLSEASLVYERQELGRYGKLWKDKNFKDAVPESQRPKATDFEPISVVNGKGFSDLEATGGQVLQGITSGTIGLYEGLEQYLSLFKNANYALGNQSMHAVDCSGLVFRFLRDIYRVSVPRNTASGYHANSLGLPEVGLQGACSQPGVYIVSKTSGASRGTTGHVVLAIKRPDQPLKVVGAQNRRDDVCYYEGDAAIRYLGRQFGGNTNARYHRVDDGALSSLINLNPAAREYIRGY